MGFSGFRGVHDLLSDSLVDNDAPIPFSFHQLGPLPITHVQREFGRRFVGPQTICAHLGFNVAQQRCEIRLFSDPFSLLRLFILRKQVQLLLHICICALEDCLLPLPSLGSHLSEQLSHASLKRILHSPSPLHACDEFFYSPSSILDAFHLGKGVKPICNICHE